MRSDGLPSDQANSLAVGADGTVYLGLQCDGIAIASAKDQYKNWKNVRGPEELLTVATGEGLPTNLMNDIAISNDGVVYAATSAGLAWSKDKGISWRFLRGLDWVDKVKQSLMGAPPNWKPISSGILQSEDYCSVLFGLRDTIYVGHRESREVNLVSDLAVTSAIATDDFATSFAATADEAILMGNYGSGICDLVPPHIRGRATLMVTAASAPLPAAAASLSPQSIAAELNNLAPKISHLPPNNIEPLADDWITRGNWIDHHGNYASILFAQGGRSNILGGYRAAFISSRTGVGTNGSDQIRYWLDGYGTDDERALQCEDTGGRRQAEVDDHGEAHARTMEGPDIFCTIKLTSGKYVVSIYFVNPNGHQGLNRIRDYEIDLVTSQLPESQFRGAEFSKNLESLFGEPGKSARARVGQFWGGVYKCFLVDVKDPGTISFRVSRNFSLNAIVSGVFIDSIGEIPPTPGTQPPPKVVQRSRRTIDATGPAQSIAASIADQFIALRDQDFTWYYCGSRLLQTEFLRTVLSRSRNLGSSLAAQLATQTDAAGFRKDLSILLASSHLFWLSDRVYYGDISARWHSMYWEWMAKIDDKNGKIHWSPSDEDIFLSRHNDQLLWQSVKNKGNNR